jgi:hypothetical protein
MMTDGARDAGHGVAPTAVGAELTAAPTYECDCAACLRADICVECDGQIDPTRFYLGTIGPFCAVCRDRLSSVPMIGEIQEAGGVEAATANGQTQGLLF